MKNTKKKSTTKKTPAKRVLTDEKRFKENSYTCEHLREYNKDPEHNKANSEYQKASYKRMKAEKTRAESNKIKYEMAKRFSDGLKKIDVSKKDGKAILVSKATAKTAVRKPVAVKKTVKIGNGSNKGK